ncbi:MAG: helix-turn-helix domain-containing protein [Anaerolineales bacterium]|nr:helix-turn-helix domain-containing protein [Anaerolineales bacterium]
MIGERIRQRRKELGLTLRELGSQTGLTASFLSQVENNQTSPSIASLQRIAVALRVPIFHFLETKLEPEMVIRRKERLQLDLPKAAISYELLTTDLSHDLGAYLIRMKPGGRHQAQKLLRQTEEVIFILEGELEITLGEKKYHLQPGDSVHYKGEQIRELASIGTEGLLAICAMTPPAL